MKKTITCTSGSTANSDTDYGEIKESKTLILSPNYPSNYDNNKYCRLKLNLAGDNKKVTLKFKDFHVETHSSCVWDYVEFRYAGTDTDPYDGTLIEPRKCGETNPATIEANSNPIYMIFRTDYSVVKQGFVIEFLGKDDISIYTFSYYLKYNSQLITLHKFQITYNFR